METIITKTHRERRPGDPIEPFRGSDRQCFLLAGEILFSSANDYKLAGQAIRRAERMAELGYYDAEFQDDELRAKEEKAFEREYTKYLQDHEVWEIAMADYHAEVLKYDQALREWRRQMKFWTASETPGEMPKKPTKPTSPEKQEPKMPRKPSHVTPHDLKRRMFKPLYRDTVRAYRGIMAREKAFILSDTFQALLGESEHTGHTILYELDRAIAEYDPVREVPEIDPETGKPYPKEQWRRICDKRSKKNGKGKQ